MIVIMKPRAHFFLFAFFICGLFLSCNRSVPINNNSARFDELLFIYDLNCIDLEARPLVDTALCLPVIFPNDSSKNILFYTDGNCSACISDLISFITEYSFSDYRDSIRLTVLLQSASLDLFEYYLNKSQTLINSDFDRSFTGLNIKSCQVEVPPLKGAYLIIHNRVVKYDPWHPTP